MNIPKYIDEFRNELTRKGYRFKSIKNYVNCVEHFLKYFDGKTEPIKVNEMDIKAYLGLFKEHNTQRGHHSAIKSFYKYTIRQPNKFKFIEYVKRSRKLPIVLSVSEVQDIFNVCSNIKHRSILAVMYSCGLRVGEVCNLLVSDIDSKRMIINVRDAKGGKDRQVMLNEKLLVLLRKYYIAYKPQQYLFEGQTIPRYSERSIGEFISMYAKKAGLNKRVYPHLMRHNCFTHLVESGCDVAMVQKIAGHQNIKTTNLYLHLSHNHISKINSPINFINL